MQGGLFFLQKTNSGGRGLFSEGKTNSEAGGAGEVCLSYKRTNSGGRGLFFLQKNKLWERGLFSYKKQTLGAGVCFS